MAGSFPPAAITSDRCGRYPSAPVRHARGPHPMPLPAHARAAMRRGPIRSGEGRQSSSAKKSSSRRLNSTARARRTPTLSRQDARRVGQGSGEAQSRRADAAVDGQPRSAAGGNKSRDTGAHSDLGGHKGGHTVLRNLHKPTVFQGAGWRSGGTEALSPLWRAPTGEDRRLLMPCFSSGAWRFPVILIPALTRSSSERSMESGDPRRGAALLSERGLEGPRHPDRVHVKFLALGPSNVCELPGVYRLDERFLRRPCLRLNCR